jgi:acyl carrier protein
MQAANADVESRLLALVKSILDQNAITAQLAPATLLVDVGLTSMDMVNLMLAVEAEFDFTIPQEEIKQDLLRVRCRQNPPVEKGLLRGAPSIQFA